MIEKVLRKKNLQDYLEVKENLVYWLSRTPEERVGAIEHLRIQYHGSSARLQKVAHIIQRSRG